MPHRTEKVIQIVDDDGKAATTHVVVVAETSRILSIAQEDSEDHGIMHSEVKRNGSCIVLCKPLTGRTHQIRVHLASVGCGLHGDELYGLGKCDIHEGREL